jgi:hypothetical protein
MNSLSIPENAGELRIKDDYVYIANRNGGLWVMDVSDHAHPIIVGSYKTPGKCNDIAVVDNLAYVTDGDGLNILDVSNPAYPVEIGFLAVPGRTRSVAIVEHYAYVLSSGSLYIIDVSDPNKPQEMGSYNLDDAYEIAVAGEYAYIAAGKGLHILNVAEPIAPLKVGFYDTPYSVRGVKVQNNDYVYLYYGGVHVIDVSNPVKPVEIGFIDLVAYDVIAIEDQAYVVGGSAGSAASRGGWPLGALWVFDVSNPSTPMQVAHISSVLRHASRIAVANDYAFIADLQVNTGNRYYASTLQVFDIADPSKPLVAGFYKLPTNESGGGQLTTEELVVENGYVYLTDQINGFFILHYSSQ